MPVNAGLTPPSRRPSSTGPEESPNLLIFQGFENRIDFQSIPMDIRGSRGGPPLRHPWRPKDMDLEPRIEPVATTAPLAPLA